MIRILDIFFSVLLLILLSPLFLFIGFCYLLQDESIFFQQKRIGRNGIIFTIFKFRTMPLDTPQLPTHDLKNARISTFGEFLRSVKLDELPQLFNVLKGDMSFVGPRPCLPSQVELVRLRSEAGVFSLRPGITGAAQIQKVDMSEPLRLVDIERSMLGEINVLYYCKILVHTLIFLIFRRC